MSWKTVAQRYQKVVTPENKDNRDIAGSFGPSEYYTFIIGYTGDKQPNFTDIENYQPRAFCRDHKGNKIASGFKEGEFRDEELKPYGDGSVDDTEVCKWTTPRDTRAALSREHQSACDTIKKWIVKNESALWWHDGNSDLCSKFGGPHLHIIGKSVPVGIGLYRRLNTGSAYTPVVKAVSAAGGYLRSMRVKSLESLILYLNTPPRLFMGSMCTKIGAIRASYIKHDIHWTSETNDLLDEWFADDGTNDTECGGDEPRRLKRNAFECTPEISDLVARVQARKFAAGYDAGFDAGDAASILPGQQPKRFKLDLESSQCGGVGPVEVPKATAKSKFVAQLEKIMMRYNVHDKEAIASLVHKMGNTTKVALFIQYLIRMGFLEKYTAAAKDSLKLVYQGMTMMEIAKKACFSGWFKEDDHLSIKTSLRYWIEWVKIQNWSISKFVKDIVTVYDKKKTKINSLVIVGQSNSGKSVFFGDVLQKLHPMYALYACSANEDRFAFGEFPGKRVAIAHEGTFGTQQLEVAKTICGGQECDVDVKHKDRVKVYRMPFFITSNKIPWMLAPCDADKLAFRNRCYFYETRVDPEVPEIEKPLHPGIWYYLLLGEDADFCDDDYTADRLLQLDEQEHESVKDGDEEEDDFEIE